MIRKGRVLFINHDLYQDDNMFTLGNAYLAAVLKRKGADVAICCQDIFHYSNQNLVKNYLEGEEYDLIGISFLAARFNETVLGLCKAINEYKKDAWLVLGGHGPSPVPEYMVRKTGADIVAIGEAEETILELLDCKLNGGRDLHKVDGIAYREVDRVLINKRRIPIKELDTIPFPEWDLYPMDIYSTCNKFQEISEDDKMQPILTGRGCYFKCNFCYRMEKGIRLRSIDNVVNEIQVLSDKYGINYFVMQDELFVTSKKRVIEFATALKTKGLKIKFHCNARVDILDEEILDSLKKSGCTMLGLGMESSNQNVLDLMNKKTTVEQNIKAAKMIRKSGIGIGLNFLWGNKGDTEETLWCNVGMLKKLNTYKQLRTIRPVTPYPGCELYYEALEKGLLSGPEEFFDNFKNSDLMTINFTDIPENEFYKLLFEANKELIIDHYQNTTKDMDAAQSMIDQFYQLYFEGNYKFRGARLYDKR